MNLTTMRERMFTMRFSDEERERAEKIADHFGLNVAGLIRMMLMDKARDLGLELAPKAATKKPRAKK